MKLKEKKTITATLGSALHGRISRARDIFASEGSLGAEGSSVHHPTHAPFCFSSCVFRRFLEQK
jgi:hypothetical protein